MILKKLKPKIIHWFRSTNHPTFHSEERLVIGQLRKRKRVLGRSIYIIIYDRIRV